MPSNGLRLSQWDSSYNNRMAAPLPSKLRLQVSRQRLTGELSATEVDGGTEVGVGGGGEIEIASGLAFLASGANFNSSLLYR